MLLFEIENIILSISMPLRGTIKNEYNIYLCKISKHLLNFEYFYKIKIKVCLNSYKLLGNNLI